MGKILQNKDIRISLIFALIGMVASLFAAMYQIAIFSQSIKQQIIAQFGAIEALYAIAALQGALITFIAAIIGLKPAKKVNLHLNFKYDKKAVLPAVLIGLATAFIITASDKFIFAGYLPPQTAYVFSPVYFAAGVLYGGIIEEILLRLLVMSLFVLVLWKLFARSKDNLNIPNGIYIAAIILAAALFAAGHIPFTIQTIGLSAPILIRCFVLNGIGGLGFGYLYWKHGLAYAMVAHAAAHVFMQLVFMPVFW